ncbi:MAG: TIM barrel protein [Clostridia bacterium]
MKNLTNITNTHDDLARFSGEGDVTNFLDEHHLDGLELLPCGNFETKCLPVSRIVGLHLGYFPCWVDFWNRDERALLAEYGSYEEVSRQFGGDTPSVMVDFYRRQLDFARQIGAEYVVFHVADVSLSESITHQFLHTDEQVMDAALDLINQVLAGRDDPFAFLVENLWWPGLTLLRPELTSRLLDGIPCAQKGIMLDTGHLMHTNLDLRTQDEALDYMHTILSRWPSATEWIRGVHLQQSLTGEFVKALLDSRPALSGAYPDRLGQAYAHILATDRHLPFETKNVRKLIERIDPQYLTHEFITHSRAEQEAFLRLQAGALRG